MHQDKPMRPPRLKKPSTQPKPSQQSAAGPKAAAAKKQSATINLAPTDAEGLAREAEILSLLTVLNASVMTAELPATLQAVKAHLYAREYAAAFGRPDYLRAYSARWVSGRALAYRSLFLNIQALVERCQKLALQGQTLRALCIGGGAGSEVLAFASIAKELSDFQVAIQATAVDVADWSPILSEMSQHVKTRWGIPDETYSQQFVHQDVLDSSGLEELDFAQEDVITSLFTTNELFAASRVRTMALLAHMTAVCRPGTLFIVAESAGSYSEVQVGGRSYPLELILDQTLVGKSKAWERVREPLLGTEETVWYRVPEQTKTGYSLQIENTHMLVRVYRKI